MQPAHFYRNLAGSYRWALPALIIIALIVMAELQVQSLNTVLTTSDTWSAGLVATSRLVLSWLLQAVLLSLVSLLNGSAPRLGLNWRVVVWASVPLALLALVQILYRSGGGVVGAPGLSGFVESIPNFADLPTFIQQIVRSLAANITLFWLWHLALLFLGARFALKGRAWSVLLVMIMWVIVLVLLPVLTNRV
jgi:hypothetical protein